MALTLATKFLFVDRNFPDAPGNMLVWLAITALLRVVIVGGAAAYTVLFKRPD